MRARGAAIAVMVSALAGCGLFDGRLNQPDAGGSATGGVPGTGGTIVVVGTGGSGAGGATGAGGAIATGGSGGVSPACTATETKAAVCSDTDPQVCTKTCGPEKVGLKTETCLSGVYVEGACQFDPARDYSCYKIPATEDPACPTTLPQAGAACTITDCVVSGGASGYLDSTGAMKLGYCVCQASATAPPPTWSCATTTAWPCPLGNGC